MGLDVKSSRISVLVRRRGRTNQPTRPWTLVEAIQIYMDLCALGDRFVFEGGSSKMGR